MAIIHRARRSRGNGHPRWSRPRSHPLEREREITVKTLEYRDHSIRYTDRGEGTPAVFLHNGAVSHRLWDYQLDHFQHTHRVIAPDLLGLGESDRPETSYTAEDYVAQLRALVDHLGLDTFHLVGCCLGGSVSLAYTRTNPERVRSLTVITAATPRTIASGPFGPIEAISRPGTRRRDLIARWCETTIGRRLMRREFMLYQCGAKVLEDPTFRDYVMQLYVSPGQWRVFCNTSYAGFSHLDSFTRPPSFPPTLMMWGGENKILPLRAGRKLAAEIQPDRSEFWPDSGYMLMRERPADTNRVLGEFFAEAETADRAARAQRAPIVDASPPVAPA